MPVVGELVANQVRWRRAYLAGADGGALDGFGKGEVAVEVGQASA